MPGGRDFDRSLEAIEAKVIELFAMIAEDLAWAVRALPGGPGEMARVLGERERAIDALYPEVEGLASREILLQAPVAADLRFLLSVLRVTPELERSHDLVMQVASRAGLAAPGAGLTPRGSSLAGQMGALACRMWEQAAGCWYRRDPSGVRSLQERAGQMSELRSSLAAELAAGQVTVPAAMETALVAHFLERLGAHAVNIVRRVRYLAGPAAG